MFPPHSPSPVGVDETPSDTRLSKSSNVSRERKRSSTVTVAGPENVHGGAGASAATGLDVPTHRPEQGTAGPPPSKTNCSQVPSAVMEVAEADRADEATITKKQTNTMLVFITLRLA